MNLYEFIVETIKSSRRAKDGKTVIALNTLLADIDYKFSQKSNKKTKDELVMSSIKSFQESLQVLVDAKGPTEQSDFEFKLYYMIEDQFPKKLTEDEIRKVILDNSLIGIGPVMAYFKKNFDQAVLDNGLISKIVRG